MPQLRDRIGMRDKEGKIKRFPKVILESLFIFNLQPLKFWCIVRHVISFWIGEMEYGKVSCDCGITG